MLKSNWKRMLKSRKTVWVLLLCLVAGAVAGTVYKNSSQKDIEQVASGETVSGEENADKNQILDDSSDQMYVMGQEETDTKSQNSAEDNNTSQKEDAEVGEEAADQQVADNDAAGEEDGDDSQEAAPAASILQARNLEFLTSSTLSWPVQGEVLLEFSMDKTVYFPTLNLYKCSQAMVIQAEEGTPVCAPAEGVVLSIGLDEQIGNYLVMDIGDGYQIKMGQLKDINVSEGDLVQEGDLLAYVASPTECYSVEGDNLYLALTADGEPVDPLDYLKY